MYHHRHSDTHRVQPGSVTPKTRRLVEWYRRRATLRKLILLECAIIRHAPFADCGRPLWELMADQPWFETVMPPAEWLRLQKSTGETPADLTGDRSWRFFRMNGHHAIRWLERYADDSDADRFLYVGTYFFYSEWSAEADRFETPEDRRDELEIRYGAASWLHDLREIGPKLWNTMDFYLGDYPGVFYRWGGYRPLHPGHRPVAVGLIEDVFGRPDDSVRFDPAWRTPDVVALASTMYETQDFSPAPALADALEKAGCDNADMLAHCRSERRHCRGCWVVDRLLKLS